MKPVLSFIATEIGITLWKLTKAYMSIPRGFDVTSITICLRGKGGGSSTWAYTNSFYFFFIFASSFAGKLIFNLFFWDFWETGPVRWNLSICFIRILLKFRKKGGINNVLQSVPILVLEQNTQNVCNLWKGTMKKGRVFHARERKETFVVSALLQDTKTFVTWKRNRFVHTCNTQEC